MLKHLLLRVGVKTGQVMVVLVTSEELMHGRKELLARLRAAHPEVATVVQNIQPRQTSVVLGEREKVLFGPGYIFDELLGLRYKISARSFYQINPAQTERLYAIIARAEAWLRAHAVTTPIIKWETTKWGEIPADFGRKKG